MAALSWAGCGKPKEAEDPRSFIEQEFEPEPGGAVPSTSPKSSASPARTPTELQATETECRRAAEHLVQLGIELAIEAETDPEKKQRLREERTQALRSEQAKEHVRAFTAECLGKGTTKLEARCIAQVKSEADIERCVAAE